MTQAINKSEQWVYDICRKSFLSIWSYVNPQGRSPDKELCDILVVCHPHVLVISVKEIKLSNSGNVSVDWDRWTKKAIDASIRQIKGAIRWLDSTDKVIQKNGEPGLPLPPKDQRIYHRIAVALGGQGEVPIFPSSVPDNHPYHILDEKSFYLLVRHLNTIVDFVDYLGAKETLLSRSGVVINGGEENLLAMYLHSERQFPVNPDMLFVEGDLWDSISVKPEFKAKLHEDEESYIWDQLIETFCSGGFKGPRWNGPELSETEIALRIMAKENRFSRRILGKAFFDFLELGKEGSIRARRAQSLSNVGYVFFMYDSDSTPEERKQELIGRCFASLYGFEECEAIVGININKPGGVPRDGYTSDLVMIQRYQDSWPDEVLENGRICREELGYFKQPQKIYTHFDEYPDGGVKDKT